MNEEGAVTLLDRPGDAMGDVVSEVDSRRVFPAASTSPCGVSRQLPGP